MKNLWEKIKSFLSQVWQGLTVAGRIVAGLIIVGLLSLIAYAATDNNNNDDSNTDKGPEVAQVYEPSIGSPLPPDNSNSASVTAQVGGASTTEPSGGADNKDEPMRVAPPTGINPDAPIKYRNDHYRFAAVLPAGSNVSEKTGQVEFSSAAGKLHYIVSVNEGNETLASIEAQLRNSSTAANIIPTKFAGHNAVQFSAAGYGTGIVFIANGKIYYLLGDKQQFNTFQTL